MAQKKVSSRTHTQQQLDDYANQHNPNNKAYKANQANKSKQLSDRKSERRNKEYTDNYTDVEWFCLGWCVD